MRFVLVVILFTSGLNATTYFVKNGGSDAAAGTADGTAWATIAKVNSISFSAGDIIQFKRGSTWNEATDAALIVSASGSAGNPITYTAYSTGALPILDGQGTVAQGVTVSSKDFITINSLQIQNNTSYNVLIATCDTCSVTGNTLSNAGVHGVNVTGASPSFTATGNTYSTSAAFAMTGKAFNIASTSASVSTISSNTIDLSQVLNTNNVSGIVVSGTNSGPVIADNVITMAQGVQGIGIKALGSSHITGGQILRNSIVGLTNSCSGCDGEAIELTGADSSHQVQTTTVAYNYCKNGSASADCIGLFWAASNNILYNFCIGNSGQNACIHISTSSPNNNFYGNNTYKSNYGFEFIGATVTGSNVQNNIAVGHQRGIGFFTSSTGNYDYNISFNNSIANYVGGTDGGHNSTSDPKWASSTPTSTADFILQSSSPAIGTGANLGSTYQMVNLNSGAFPYSTVNQNSYGTGWEVGSFISAAIVREVGPAQTYATISACMTASSSGDICNIHTATYTEQVTCKAGVTMRNNPGDTITLQSTSSPLINANSFCTVASDVNGHFFITYTGSGAAPIVINHTHGSNIDGVTLTNLVLTVAGGSGEGTGIYIADCDLCNITGNTIHISATTGSHDGANFYFNSHLTFNNNLIYGEPCSTATHLEDGIVASGTNLTFSGNTLHDGCAFDNHPDGIVIQGDGNRSGGDTDSVTVANNTIYNFTQGIYPDAIHASMTNILIYNNVVYETSSYRYGGVANKMNCAVLDGESLSGPSWNIQVGFYNNTLDCKQLHLYTLRLGAATAITIKNNITLNTPFAGFIFTTLTGTTIDYDFFSGSNSQPLKVGSTAYSRATFISNGFGETNSNAGTALLNANYSEQAGSPTRNVGTNLTSIFITDITGTGRPPFGAWDTGAYQYFVSGNPIIRRR